MFKYVLIFTLVFSLVSCKKEKTTENILPTPINSAIDKQIVEKNILFKAFLSQKDYAAAQKLANEQVGDIAASPASIAWGNYNMGMLYWEQNKLSASLEKFLAALSLFEQLGMKTQVAITHHKVGSVYSDLLAYEKAKTFLLKAVNNAAQITDKIELSKLYRNLGFVYQNINDFNNAKKYYEKSLDLRLQLNNSTSLIVIYRDLGKIHKELKNYPQALFYYTKLLSISQNTNSPTDLASAYNNIGNIYKSQSNYSKALTTLQQALALKNQIEDVRLIAIIYQNFGHVALLQKQYNKALLHLHEAETVAQNVNAKEELAEIYGFLEKAYLGLGNMQKAYQYSKMSNKMQAGLLENSKDLLAKNLQQIALAEQKAITYNPLKAPTANQVPYVVAISLLSLAIILVAGRYFAKNRTWKNTLAVVHQQKDAFSHLYTREKEAHNQVLTQFKSLEAENSNAYDELDDAYSDLYKDYKEGLKKEALIQEEKNQLLVDLEEAKNKFVALEQELQKKEAALLTEHQLYTQTQQAYLNFKELYEQVVFALELKKDYKMLELLEQIKQMYLRGERTNF